MNPYTVSLAFNRFLLVVMMLTGSVFAGVTDLRVKKDIVFARSNQGPLKLDLYLPPGSQSGPLIVWIHGGAWRSGSRDELPLGELVREGCAAASVDYRLSTTAKFPAQIHDIKAAIRFLRGQAGKL